MSDAHSSSWTHDELKQFGDFGIGDGLIMIDRKALRFNQDGVVLEAEPNFRTPYAVVTFFEQDLVFDVESLNFDYFRKAVEWKRPVSNQVYAIRVSGYFHRIKLRNAESEYELKKVSGSMIGFVHPSFYTNVSEVGCSLIFLDKERKRAGPVLDFKLTQGRIELDEASTVRIILPAKIN